MRIKDKVAIYWVDWVNTIIYCRLPITVYDCHHTLLAWKVFKDVTKILKGTDTLPITADDPLTDQTVINRLVSVLAKLNNTEEYPTNPVRHRLFVSAGFARTTQEGSSLKSFLAKSIPKITTMRDQLIPPENAPAPRRFVPT